MFLLTELRSMNKVGELSFCLYLLYSKLSKKFWLNFMWSCYIKNCFQKVCFLFFRMQPIEIKFLPFYLICSPYRSVLVCFPSFIVQQTNKWHGITNIIGNRDSSLGIAAIYELDSRGSIPGRSKIFLFPIASRLALGSIQPPIQWIRTLYPRG
jgi:hypothetical protein